MNYGPVSTVIREHCAYTCQTGMLSQVDHTLATRIRLAVWVSVGTLVSYIGEMTRFNYNEFYI